jgi:myosin heavy subunit
LGNRLGDLQLDYDFTILGDIPPTDIDLQNFLALCDSLELLRFKEEEIYQIFEILAALLHLGGVKNA